MSEKWIDKLLTPADVAKQISAAKQEIYRLCQGEQFTMSIPVREHVDSDRIIHRALISSKKLIEAQQQVISESTGLINALCKVCPYGKPATCYDDCPALVYMRNPLVKAVEGGEK